MSVEGGMVVDGKVLASGTLEKMAAGETKSAGIGDATRTVGGDSGEEDGENSMKSGGGEGREGSGNPAETVESRTS